jgi:hypothetical protein
MNPHQKARNNAAASTTEVKLKYDEYHTWVTQDQRPMCKMLGKETVIKLWLLHAQDSASC